MHASLSTQQSKMFIKLEIFNPPNEVVANAH